jgi:hypothetical protein
MLCVAAIGSTIVLRCEAAASFREDQTTESHCHAEQAKQTGADTVTVAFLAAEGLPDQT